MPFQPPGAVTRPGLFITGTDTGVGKTLVACAIADSLATTRRVGVCKPFATGCQRDQAGQLVHDDAQALARAARCQHPADIVSPIRFTDALAPAVASEVTDVAIDWPALNHALNVLNHASDLMLVEGVGGVMVPLDADQPTFTVRDLIACLALPAVVVTRAGLGTLNHTAMTVHLLREVGCRIAGLVINEHGLATDDGDASPAHNPRWLERMTGLPILATLPDPGRVAEAGAGRGGIPDPVRRTIGTVDWMSLMEPKDAVEGV
ncbi:MAG: dethiobiotin synthase [Phycisphaeraceae bacterium]